VGRLISAHLALFDKALIKPREYLAHSASTKAFWKAWASILDESVHIPTIMLEQEIADHSERQNLVTLALSTGWDAPFSMMT